MGKWLKICRVAVEAVVFGIMASALTGLSSRFNIGGVYLEKIQFVNAALAFSLTTIVAWLAVTLLFGRIYCSTVCPMAAVQDIVARCSIAMVRHGRAAYTFTRPLNRLRYATLLIVFAMLVFGLTSVLLVLDPFTIFSRTVQTGMAVADRADNAPWLMGAAGMAGYILAVAAFLIISALAARSGRTFCNTLCPVGSTLSFVARNSILHIDINPDKCIQCRRCERVCKAGCIDVPAHTVDTSRCVVCFNCVTGCPNDAIRYTIFRHRLSYPLLQRIDEAMAGTVAPPQSGANLTPTSTTSSSPNEDLS